MKLMLIDDGRVPLQFIGEINSMQLTGSPSVEYTKEFTDVKAMAPVRGTMRLNWVDHRELERLYRQQNPIKGNAHQRRTARRKNQRKRSGH